MTEKLTMTEEQLKQIEVMTAASGGQAARLSALPAPEGEYAGLVKRLREKRTHHFDGPLLDNAANAIEALMRERDEASAAKLKQFQAMDAKCEELMDREKALREALKDVVSRLVEAFPATETFLPIMKARAALENSHEPVVHDRDDDLLRRGDVIAMLSRLADQHADLALYGAPENARNREAHEAAITRVKCAVAFMEAALENSHEP